MTDTKNTVSDERPSQLAMEIAVHMEVHAALSTTTEAKAREIDALLRADKLVFRASIPGGVGVKVKPLEWSSEPPYSVARVSSIRLLYSIEAVWDEGGFQRVELRGGFASGDFPTVAEAKAAAQADHEQRILSALDLSPAEGGPVGIVGFDDVMDGLRVTLYAGAAVSEGDEVYAAPSNPAVSDAMVKRAAAELKRLDKIKGVDAYYERIARDTLTAALSVKPQSGSDKP